MFFLTLHEVFAFQVSLCFLGFYRRAKAFPFFNDSGMIPFYKITQKKES
jgi:hypothetical protein